MSIYHEHQSGDNPTNAISRTIQIQRKINFAVIPVRAIKSQHNFAHDTTAQLSCHVQNFVVIS